ncbi:hypothetical protein PHYSODRAFT_534175 [Phytophthora sojae]|uniref:WLGC domain-containing protein n=1 Tax=Phytophthora sojae (strain P6497) TaxID=1094619 RepID=G5AG56_PHYSP|nr:hypothetical protein PHYSODRAFT_534175 [Phytophthora sojae]EGZ05568.1 hypothetical protein PHYSODRAFT_534175 [Phytophthora sojae]|eukprot:XP_009539099.1 hypothetical protein PHYSODRAFT_534175 [Phytophthora sojae]
MGTGDFDDGNFWLIIDPDPTLTAINAMVLAILALSYVQVLVKMTIRRNSRLRITPVGPTEEEVHRQWVSNVPYVGIYLHQAAVFGVELTGYYGRYRKFWNVLFKVGDLVVETIQLHHLLEAGFSASLSYGYSALIAANCLMQAFFILNPVRHHTAFTEVLVDTVFDMLFAIGCPIFLLGYSYTTFDLDRAVARLYLKVFFPGSFQRQARMQADPIGTTLFRFSFDSLRTLTWSDLVIRLAMNIAFSYRLSRLRSVPRGVGVLFVGASIFALVYTSRCISDSQGDCKAYPECVAFAYRWDNRDVCPCLAIVDVDRAPKTYEEWIHPLDVTATVRSLATSGDLEVLQLTNRQMVTWPEELQRCVNLEYLSLYYTGVEVVPDWFKVFHNLQFLDLQGKFGDTNIVSMPPDAFLNMGSLTFMHLGYLQLLPELPSFEGLCNLKSMSLALLYSLTALPALMPLAKLQQLELVSLNSLQTLPEVTSNHHLSHVVVWQAQLCCNGFLGACNTSAPVCSGMPASDCLTPSDRPSAESLGIIATQPEVCAKNAPFIPPAEPPLKSQVDACGGVLYRQCRDTLFASEPVGMCINNFFQVIACSSIDKFSIYVRQQEILYGIGTPCDPKEEAWLGCNKRQ